MKKFSRFLYWVGLIFGGIFLLLNIVPISVMLGILPGAENGKPWIGMMILSILGLGSWFIGWAFRYLATGAKSLSPKDKGWYQDVGG